VAAAANTGMRLLNSIVVGTDALVGDPDDLLARASIVPTSILGPGCIDADPQCVNIAGGDFRLAPGDPAIDAGLDWLLPEDSPDLDGDGDTAEFLPVDRDGSRGVQGSGEAVCGVAWSGSPTCCSC
jgi:hypothetical protein